MIEKPDPMQPTMHTSGPTESSTSQVLKIVGIVVLVGVALCGLAGTCLLLFTFVLPLIQQ
jgi:hypothetical protein